MTDAADLTARARIRDAALRCFGADGFERATIRGIAEAAGVSSGLIRHHFGTKEALREACDAHLAKLIRELNDRALTDRNADGVNHVAAARVALGTYEPYLTRSLTEGGAAMLFDELVERGQQWIADADTLRDDPPDVDVKTRAAVHAAMALSVTLLHEHLSRALGVDVHSAEGDRMLARALIDIRSHPLLSPEAAAAAKAALDGASDHPKP